MRTSVSSKANHLTWRELRSDIRTPLRDAQPLEGRNRAFLLYLQGAAESSRTSITLACEHGHTRRKRSRKKGIRRCRPQRYQSWPLACVSQPHSQVVRLTPLRRNICALHLLRPICYMVARGPRCPAEGSFSGWVLPVRRRYWALRGGSQLAHGHVQCVSSRNPHPPFGSSTAK
jgi:hypothetical protein